MTAADVRRVIEEALQQTRARPQVVTDRGSQFTGAEFKELVRRFGRPAPWRARSPRPAPLAYASPLA